MDLELIAAPDGHRGGRPLADAVHVSTAASSNGEGKKR